ncbi:hypothetical protein J2W42_002912 [Rhizobium tibeticum]|uniref:DUF1275 family protein n=1 Tax=Rhizobium tibeticum TaxID=501024 RepID=UPI002781E31B|nr:hypothetical protein [Rhizobium tibeticum]
MGSSGALPKLVALPMFCLLILTTRIVGLVLHRAGRPVLKCLLATKVILLIAAAIFSVVHGPFTNAAAVANLVMGMTLVSAMAIQNALHRVHLAKSPPSTLMTGTTTQIKRTCLKRMRLDLYEHLGVEQIGRVFRGCRMAQRRRAQVHGAPLAESMSDRRGGMGRRRLEFSSRMGPDNWDQSKCVGDAQAHHWTRESRCSPGLPEQS